MSKSLLLSKYLRITQTETIQKFQIIITMDEGKPNFYMQDYD